MILLAIKLENGTYKSYSSNTPLRFFFNEIKTLAVETIIFAEVDENKVPKWEKNFSGGAVDFGFEKRLNALPKNKK